MQPLPSLSQRWEAFFAGLGLRLLAAVGILLLGLLLARLAGAGLRGALQRTPLRRRTLLVNFLTRTAVTVIVVFAGVTALGHLGVNIGPLIAGIGITGFIVGFAFKDSLSNLAAGLLLLFYQPFDEGDFVEIGGTQGTVLDMSVAATELKMADGRLAIIPNSRIWNASIINFNKLGRRRLEWRLAVPQPAAAGVLAEVARQTVAADARVLREPAPQVQLEQLGEAVLELGVRAWVAPADFAAVASELGRALAERLEEARGEPPSGRRVAVQLRTPAM